jgi:hypothetical protein
MGGLQPQGRCLHTTLEVLAESREEGRNEYPAE